SHPGSGVGWQEGLRWAMFAERPPAARAVHVRCRREPSHLPRRGVAQCSHRPPQRPRPPPMNHSRTKAVIEPDYWAGRLDVYGDDLRRVIWADSDQCWDRMEAEHRLI